MTTPETNVETLPITHGALSSAAWAKDTVALSALLRASASLDLIAHTAKTLPPYGKHYGSTDLAADLLPPGN